MKITIESTQLMTEVSGVTCRVWRGITESGVRCDLAIPLIRVLRDQDHAQFEAELKPSPNTPHEESRRVDMRYIW